MTESEHNERWLSIPEVVLKDTNSIELARVWISNSEQHFTLQLGLWDDIASWGILLADLAKNVAKAYGEEHDEEVETLLYRIRQAFVAEVDAPTE